MIDVAHNGDQEPPEDPGGQGELIDPHHVRGDLRLIRRAAKSDWPIGRKRKRAYVRELDNLVKSSDERIKLGALRTAAMMDRANVARNRVAPEVGELHQHVHFGGDGSPVVVYIPDNGRDPAALNGHSSNGNQAT